MAHKRIHLIALFQFRLVTLILLFVTYSTHATTWRVGPTRPYTFCSQVAPLVQNGDTILIDASTYVNDPQVKWSKNNLLIKGVGGRPVLRAGSIIANDAVNGKGIFVISGANVTVENIEFADAAVIDHNGAGIRQEGANLFVRYCKFSGNEMGILCGNIPNCKTVVEYTEFVNGGSVLNPGYQHNIYINHIDTFIFRYNYSHDAIAEGHELKSRANNNFILYNRIANEQSVDSRTIDLPNGGTTVVVGNIIEQGPNSANSNLLGYGLEGLSNPGPHNVWICNNTFVNKKTTGSFIQVATGTDTLFVKNNILAGAKTGGLIIGAPTVLDSSHNVIHNQVSAISFVDAAHYNYHLTANSPAVDAGVLVPAVVRGNALHAHQMYVDTCQTEIRNLYNQVDVGAFEFAPVSAQEEAVKSAVRVFPNPSSGLLHVFTGEEQLERACIFDMAGLLLGAFSTNDIHIDDLNSGLYLMTVQTKKGTVALKIMKY